MEFHLKLQALRKQRGLTQEELAAALYVSRTAISKWESNRGYPNIDSLKALAAFFGVTIDALLSGDELLTLAREDTRQARNHFCDLAYGLLDVSAVLLFLLPFFGQRTEAGAQAVSLLALAPVSPWLKVAYGVLIAGIMLTGLVTLALQNTSAALWMHLKRAVSLGLNGAGVFLFILSPQPYAAALLFVFMIVKVFLLLKRP